MRTLSGAREGSQPRPVAGGEASPVREPLRSVRRGAEQRWTLRQGARSPRGGGDGEGGGCAKGASVAARACSARSSTNPGATRAAGCWGRMARRGRSLVFTPARSGGLCGVGGRQAQLQLRSWGGWCARRATETMRRAVYTNTRDQSGRHAFARVSAHWQWADTGTSWAGPWVLAVLGAGAGHSGHTSMRDEEEARARQRLLPLGDLPCAMCIVCPVERAGPKRVSVGRRSDLRS